MHVENQSLLTPIMILVEAVEKVTKNLCSVFFPVVKNKKRTVWKSMDR